MPIALPIDEFRFAAFPITLRLARMSQVVKCPTCKKPGEWFQGSFGPFCSKRCRLIDLGKWLGEGHAISEPLRPEHFKDYEELPPGKELDEPE